MTLPTKALAAASLCLAIGAVPLVLSLAGCAPEETHPETAKVSGVVLYQGEPVAQAEVTFRPEGEGDNGLGRTDAQGKFVISTYGQQDGAVVGKHVVTVQLFPEGGLPGAEVESTDTTPIPPKYADPAATPLSEEVKSGANNEFEFTLED
jgi:hypothetical protein